MNSEYRQTDISKSGQADKLKFQHHLDMPYIKDSYKAAEKLSNKAAIITGGDSGIGRAVAVHFAREGADVSIVYHHSDNDASDTMKMIEAEGRKCLLFKGDISDERFCSAVTEQTYKTFNRLDILVNNAGSHKVVKDIADISQQQLEYTFAVNIFSFFYFTQAALRFMKEGSAIINTSSVTASVGSAHLLDYSASKGAIASFTRSLAINLAPRNIRVNAVSPGPIWTPIVIYSYNVDYIERYGKGTPLGRAGYPYEVAPAFVWLASEESSYITGQTIHVNGGIAV